MWPITQSSPMTVGCSSVVCDGAVVLHAGSLADDDLAVVTAQYRARPHRAVRTDGDTADHDRIRMHIGVAMY